MPHVQRKRGENGFYHVVTKGDGGQVIFENNADRARYLEILDEATTESKVRLYAYCLMGNHTHLLIEDLENELSTFMKELDETYARYFAKTTGRVGHVFQGRFWSEPIDAERHFLAVLRYIHANPEVARICKAQDYPWSSYHLYARNAETSTHHGKLGAYADAPPVETELALSILGSVEAFERLSESGACFSRPFTGSKLSRHLSPDELANVALNLLGRDAMNEIRTLEPAERVPYLALLKQADFTIGEIARITGIGQSSVSRALNPKN